MDKQVFTITGLEKQKNRPWRTSIFLDGEFWRAYDNETIDLLDLHIGKKLNKTELEELAFQLEKKRAINRAVQLLSYRARSKNEIENRLEKAGFDLSIIRDTIKDLENLGYIDDDGFAESWMQDRLFRKCYGPFRIRNELQQKGIANELIDEKINNLSDHDEYRLASEAARIKFEKIKINIEDKRKAYGKLYQFLQRRGFSSSIIHRVCKELVDNLENTTDLS